MPRLQAFSFLPPTTDGRVDTDDIDDIFDIGHDQIDDNYHLCPLLVEGIEVDVPKMED